MGLGLLGRGVGDARYLAECAADLIVTDLKTREELASSVAQLESFKNITFILGEHRLEDFRDRDLILKAAGVPLNSPFIAEAEKKGIPVRMSADLFVELAGISVIGITGTRGKSTVTHMVAAILGEAKKLVLLGGNVRGVSNLQLLQEATLAHARLDSARQVAVLELDSWQLQGFGAARMSPHISVFTTFYPDHLNYYKNNLEAYLADKANIFLYQKPEDILILGSQCAGVVQSAYQKSFGGRFEVWGAHDLPNSWKLRIPGEHNRYNAALALAVARASGIPDEISRHALESFAGVSGRLELIAEKNGVRVYNDTTATTPEATLAALNALDVAHTVVIAGGTDKALNLDKLVIKLKEAKWVILLAGSGTERIRAEFPDAPVYDALAPAVADAFTHATSGDTVLFSPGFTSFGMFKNEYDRGDQFNAFVEKL